MIAIEESDYLLLEEVIGTIADSKPADFQRYADAYKAFKKMAAEVYTTVFVPTKTTKERTYRAWKRRKERISAIRMCAKDNRTRVRR